MGGFFVMSFIGLLWNDSYYAIISEHGWFIAYTMFFGWWISILPTREYYKHHEQYFEDYL